MVDLSDVDFGHGRHNTECNNGDFIEIMKYILVITSIFSFLSCASNKVDRRLVSEGTKTFPWKIFYVTENNFPVGKKSFYEVKYNDKDFVLPQELFGTQNDIKTFVSASDFNTSDTDYGAVVLVFYKIAPNDTGHSVWELKTALVRKLNIGKENHFSVSIDGYEQIFELK